MKKENLFMMSIGHLQRAAMLLLLTCLTVAAKATVHSTSSHTVEEITESYQEKSPGKYYYFTITFYNGDGDDGIITSDDVSEALNIYREENYTKLDNSGGQIYVNVYYRFNVIIQEGITEIGAHAFDCVNQQSDNVKYCCNYSTYTLPSSLKKIDDYAFYYSNGSFSFPENNNIEVIGEHAFHGCSDLLYKSLNLTSHLTSIGAYAFYYSCAKLTFEDTKNWQSIGDNAFYSCTLPTSVIIYPGTTVGSKAFVYTNVEKAMLLNPDNVAEDAFSTSTTIDNGSNMTYDDWLDYYSDKNVTELYIPNDNVTTNGTNLNSLFKNVTKVTFGSYVTTIGASLFECNGSNANNIEAVIFNSNVTVGDKAFCYNNKLANLTSEKITSCGASSFAHCTSLTSLDLSACETLGSLAFGSCNNITTLSIGSAMTSFDYSAFSGAKVETLYINSNAILGKTYSNESSDSSTKPLTYQLGNSLKSIVIGDDVTAIGACAFADSKYSSTWNKNLTSVTIGKNVATMDATAFACSRQLTDVTINSNALASATYAADNNLSDVFPYLKNLTFGADVKTVGDYCFYYDVENLNNTTYPLQTISFSNGLETISQNAFGRCTNLTYLSIPESVTSCDVTSFTGCTSLTNVSIESPSLMNPATAYTSDANLADVFPYMTDLSLGTSVTTIGDYAFYAETTDNFPLKTIMFSGIPTIGSSAFEKNTSLETIYEYVGSVGERAFYGCTNLATISIVGCETIGGNAFYGCTSLSAVQMQEGLKTIGTAAFGKCRSLENVELPTSLEKVESNAFRECTKLDNVVIPENVTTCKSTAFLGDTSLKHVTINSASITTKTYVETSNLADKFAYMTDLTLGENVTRINSFAFYVGEDETYPLTNVTFLGTPSIGYETFKNNASLTTITGNVKDVDEYSFSGCSSLTSIAITDDATIEHQAFAGCSSLASITLPDNVETIGAEAFKGCTALNNVTLPSSVTSIGNESFSGCTGLKQLTCYNSNPVALTDDMNVFEGVTECELQVYGYALESYKVAPVWKDFYSFFDCEGVILVDGEAYTNDSYVMPSMVRYTRTFPEAVVNKWQCLYVPFQIEVTEELNKDFDFAKLYMISFKDEDGDGEISDSDPLVMVWHKASVGQYLKYNTPYFIKAKSAGTKKMDFENVAVFPVQEENGTVDCSTTEAKYTLTGVYNTTNINGKYTLNGSGAISYYTEDHDL